MSRQRGAALVLALAVISIGALIAVVTLELASSAYSRAYADARRQALRNIAEAGIEYARHEMVVKQDTELSVARSCGEGAFVATCTRVEKPTTGVKVTSTATLDGKSMTVERIIGPGFQIPRPFDYAIAIDGSDTTGQRIRTGTDGNVASVRLNGSLWWATSSSIFGDLIVAGSVTPPGPTVSGRTITGARPLWFPSYDIEWYKKQGIVHTGNLTISAPTGSSNPVIIVVTGSLSVTGGISTGTGVIVAGTEIRFRNASTTYGPGSKWVYIAPRIRVDAPVRDLHGYLYVPSGQFQYDGRLTVFGSIACKQMVSNDQLVVNHDPSLKNDPDLGWNLKVPGYF